MKILAFDIGGSKIAYAVADKNGVLQTPVTKIATPKIASDIEALIFDIAKRQKCEGAAIATAGVVKNNRLMGKPNNLPVGYENIDFGVSTGLPFVMENDANAAVWAEYKTGALKGCEHCAMLTLGTDVGCGLVLDGKLYRGKSGAAGEICVAASGTSLAGLAAQNGLEESDCFAIYQQAQNGNLAAQKAYQQWQNNLAEAIVAINRLLDLEKVALSGSLAKIADYAKLSEVVNAKCCFSPLKIVAATAEEIAGLVGAALLFAQKQMP